MRTSLRQGYGLAGKDAESGLVLRTRFVLTLYNWNFLESAFAAFGIFGRFQVTNFGL